MNIRLFSIRIAFIAVLLIMSACKDEIPPESPKIPTDGLLLFMTFEGNANDISGKGNHGSLLGNAAVAGNLLVGNNGEDALSVPSTVMNGLVDFTITAWLKINTLRNESHEFISGANIIEDNVLIVWYNEAANEWNIGINDISTDFESDSRMEDGDWHHLSITRSGNIAILYLDGTQIGESVLVENDALEIDPNGLFFGQDQDSLGGSFHKNDCWAGAMDNLRIYNRSLNLADIQLIAEEER